MHQLAASTHSPISCCKTAKSEPERRPVVKNLTGMAFRAFPVGIHLWIYHSLQVFDNVNTHTIHKHVRELKQKALCYACLGGAVGSVAVRAAWLQ